MAEDVNVKLHGDASGLVAEAKKAEEALKKAGDEAAKAPEKTVTAVQKLRAEYKALQEQAALVGVTNIAAFKKVDDAAKGVQNQLRSLRNLGKQKNDVFELLGQTMSRYAAGLVSLGFVVSRLNRFVSESIDTNASLKAKIDDVEKAGNRLQTTMGNLINRVDDASGFTKDLASATNLVASAFGFASSTGNSFLKTLEDINLKIAGAAIGGGLGAATSALGGIGRLAGTDDQGRGGMIGIYDRLKPGVEKSVKDRSDEIRGRIDYNVAKELERQRLEEERALMERNRPFFPFPQPLPLEEDDPASLDTINRRKSRTAQKELGPTRGHTLRQTPTENIEKMNAGLIRGAHAFVSIMSSGLIRVTDSFEGRLLKAAAAFVSQMLLAQGGGLGFIGSILGGVFAAGGTDFTTRGPTLLIVGDNPGGRERVTVEPLSGRGQTRMYGNAVAMAGGGSISTYPSGGYSQSITAVANVDVYLGDKRLVRNIDYGIRARAKELNDRRGVAA